MEPVLPTESHAVNISHILPPDFTANSDLSWSRCFLFPVLGFSFCPQIPPSAKKDSSFQTRDLHSTIDVEKHGRAIRGGHFPGLIPNRQNYLERQALLGSTNEDNLRTDRELLKDLRRRSPRKAKPFFLTMYRTFLGPAQRNRQGTDSKGRQRDLLRETLNERQRPPSW